MYFEFNLFFMEIYSNKLKFGILKLIREKLQVNNFIKTKMNYFID